uniref:Leukocyte receptor cluster member 1 n=1 Tax=Nothobranchius furzeri TaxID=105023 RepID=A0A8C6M071_NOTFU
RRGCRAQAPPVPPTTTSRQGGLRVLPKDTTAEFSVRSQDRTCNLPITGQPAQPVELPLPCLNSLNLVKVALKKVLKSLKFVSLKPADTLFSKTPLFKYNLHLLIQEKQERAIGLLVSLGPQPGSEVTPWYLKSSKDKESQEKDKKKGISEEEKEKKDRRLKSSLDPLNEMKKALDVFERKVPKNRKKEKRDKVEKQSSGESSMERLRAERLQREAEERRKTQALLEQRSGKRKESERELNDRERPYNSAYFPELARKRQRRDRESWRDEILKS